MNFTFVVGAAGVERKLTLLADSVKQLDPALRIFDRYLRTRIRSRFAQQGPGWPPLAESTLAHRRGAAMAVLERKLGRDVRRRQQTYARRFGALEALGVGGFEKQRAAGVRAIQRRLTTLAEFRRIQAGGAADKTLFEGRSAEKQQTSLAGRIGRAETRASEKVLGRIASSFRSTIKAGTLTVESKIPWAGVHNDGGTGGHGARIPARPFLYLDEGDVEALTEILRARMVVALEGVTMALPDLKLDRERAALYRLAESMWWGQPCERLEIATLHPRGPSWGWFVLVGLFVLFFVAPRGC